MSEPTTPDPLDAAVAAVNEVLARLRESGGPVAVDWRLRKCWIAEAPVPDAKGLLWACQRPGPQVKLEATFTDTSRADELPLANYAHGYGPARQVDTAGLESTIARR